MEPIQTISEIQREGNSSFGSSISCNKLPVESRSQFAAKLKALFENINVNGGEGVIRELEATPPPRRGGGARFRGVTKHKRTQRFEAHIWDAKKQIYLGGFDSEIMAAMSHDIMAIRCKGASCAEILNFPRRVYEELAPCIERLTRDDVVNGLRSYSKAQTAAKSGNSHVPISGSRNIMTRAPRIAPKAAGIRKKNSSSTHIIASGKRSDLGRIQSILPRLQVKKETSGAGSETWKSGLTLGNEKQGRSFDWNIQGYDFGTSTHCRQSSSRVNQYRNNQPYYGYRSDQLSYEHPETPRCPQMLSPKSNLVSSMPESPLSSWSGDDFKIDSMPALEPLIDVDDEPLPFSDSFLFEPVNTIGSESDLEQLSGSILSEKNPSESSTWLLDSFGEDVENLNMDFTRDTPCLFS